MKKNKFLSLLLGLVAFIFISPVVANAKTVNVYFFRSSTCPHCQEAQAFFEELQQDEEYKDLFVIKDYEVSSKANVNLMEKAIEKMGNNSSGAVPYIIIGNQSWSGYADTYDDEIISKIESEYETSTDERYDIMNYVDGDYQSDSNSEEDSNYASDVAVVIAIVLVVAGVGFGIWYARKKAA